MALGKLFRSGDGEDRSLSYQQVWGSGGNWNSYRSASGTNVNYDTALSISTVYSCVRLLTDTISTLPVDTFFRKDGERLPFRPKPMWVDQPDIGTSREDHIQQVVLSLLLAHGSVTRIYRNSLGEVVSLQVLDPLSVEPRVNPTTREVEYIWDDRIVIPARDIKYVSLLKKPGQIKGVDPLAEVKETLGLTEALDTFSARFFSGGSNVGGVVEVPAVLTKEQAQTAKEAFEATHKGNDNAHGVAVLGGGGKFVKSSVDPEQSQLLDARRFAVESVARVFRVPLHMLQIAAPGVQSYASNEENAIQFAVYTLRPIVSKIESAYSALLPGGAFLKFNMDAILRGNLPTRFAAYSTGINSGFMTINDVHRLEDMRPVSGGDVVRVPLTNVNVNAADLTETDKKVTMAQKLVIAGFDPAETLAALGLPPITHTGLPSTQLQLAASIDPENPAAAYPVRAIEETP